VLRVRPVSAIRIRGIVDHLKEFGMLARELKLFAHLGEAGAAIFLVEQFEYGGHRHPHRRNSSSEIFCFLLNGSVMRAVCRLRQPKLNEVANRLIRPKMEQASLSSSHIIESFCFNWTSSHNLRALLHGEKSNYSAKAMTSGCKHHRLQRDWWDWWFESR